MSSTTDTSIEERYGRALTLLDCVRDIADGRPEWAHRHEQAGDRVVVLPAHILDRIRAVTS